MLQLVFFLTTGLEYAIPFYIVKYVLNISLKKSDNILHTFSYMHNILEYIDIYVYTYINIKACVNLCRIYCNGIMQLTLFPFNITLSSYHVAERTIIFNDPLSNRNNKADHVAFISSCSYKRNFRHRTHLILTKAPSIFLI